MPGKRRAQGDARGGAQALRPRLGGAERRGRPVHGAAALAHLSVAREKRGGGIYCNVGHRLLQTPRSHGIEMATLRPEVPKLACGAVPHNPAWAAGEHRAGFVPVGLGRCWVPGAGCRVPGAGCRVPGAGCRVPGAGCRVPGAGCRVPGAGCRVPGAGCRVPGAGCRVPGAGCRVLGAGVDRVGGSGVG